MSFRYQRAVVGLCLLASALCACSVSVRTGSAGAPSSAAVVPASHAPASTPTVPPPAPTDASFPADTADAAGPAVPGSTTDRTGQMRVADLSIEQKSGYTRLTVVLSTSGAPEWTLRYTTSPSTAKGRPAEVEGDAFLELTLHTRAEDNPVLSSAHDDAGLVESVRNTDVADGYERVLIGTRGGTLPFSVSTVTDPGRIIIDFRPPA